MNPWNVLGWIIVFWISFISIGIIFTLSKGFLLVIKLKVSDWGFRLQERIKHYKTRHVAPDECQRWYGPGVSYLIRDVTTDDRIYIDDPNRTVLTMAEWKQKILKEKLYLFIRH